MEAILKESALSMARRLREREISSEELVSLHLERIDEVNPGLNAVVQMPRDRALEEARAADAALASGGDVGLLHGVPMTLKDSHETEGVISTCGTLGRKEFVPSEDSTVTARLRAEGAMVVGGPEGARMRARQWQGWGRSRNEPSPSVA